MDAQCITNPPTSPDCELSCAKQEVPVGITCSDIDTAKRQSVTPPLHHPRSPLHAPLNHKSQKAGHRIPTSEIPKHTCKILQFVSAKSRRLCLLTLHHYLHTQQRPLLAPAQLLFFFWLEIENRGGEDCRICISPFRICNVS